MKQRNILVMLLALILSVSIAACDTNNAPPSSEAQPETSDSAPETSEPSEQPEAPAEPEVSETPVTPAESAAPELTKVFAPEGEVYQLSTPEEVTFTLAGSEQIPGTDLTIHQYSWSKGSTHFVQVLGQDFREAGASDVEMTEQLAASSLPRMSMAMRQAGASVEEEDIREVEVAGVNGYAQKITAKGGGDVVNIDSYVIIKDDVMFFSALLCDVDKFEEEEAIFLAMINSIEITRPAEA